MSSQIARCLSALVLATFVAAASNAVDVYDQTEVVVAWDAAPGPVEGYYVIVSRNEAPSSVEGTTGDPGYSLSGETDETLQVWVAAYGADGVAGPLSRASEPIRFLASAPADPDAADPSGSEDPVPPPDETSPDPDPTELPPVAEAPPMDFDCDGFSDLLIQDASGGHTLWSMQGSHVASRLPLPVEPDLEELVATGDYDGDGCQELLWRDLASGALTIRTLAGGALSDPSPVGVALPLDDDWQVLGSDDLDADGTGDLHVYSRSRSASEAWLMESGTVRQRIAMTEHAGSWILASTLDIGGDGGSELLWQRIIERDLELYLPATATPVDLGSLLPGWRVLDSGDFDGNGVEELLLHDPGAEAAQILEVSSAGPGAAVSLPTTSGLGKFAATGDYDGDGRDDVAWDDAASGSVTIWLDGAAREERVSQLLPQGSRVVSLAPAELQAAYAAACDADLNDDAAIDGTDFKLLRSCLDQEAVGICAAADLDLDGRVTRSDRKLFRERFSKGMCR